MEFVILFVFIIYTLVFKYLLFFKQRNTLPHIGGVTVFLFIGQAIVFMNSIYLFGFIQGFVIFLLFLFEIPFFTFLWIFLFPIFFNINKRLTKAYLYFTGEPTPNMFVYSMVPYIIFLLFVVFVINVFLNDFGYLELDDYLDVISDYWIYVLIGNILRIFVTNFFLKNINNTIDNCD